MTATQEQVLTDIGETLALMLLNEGKTADSDRLGQVADALDRGESVWATILVDAYKLPDEIAVAICDAFDVRGIK